MGTEDQGKEGGPGWETVKILSLTFSWVPNTGKLGRKENVQKAKKIQD